MHPNTVRPAHIAFALAILIVFAAGPAFAQAGAILDAIPSTFQARARSWEVSFRNYAMRLFWLLAAIQFIWAAFRNMFSANGESFFATMLTQIFVTGFFLLLLTFSTEWSQAIVNSFRFAANDASQASGGTVNLAPSNIMNTGINIGKQFLDAVSVTAPATSLGYMICAVIVIVVFALIVSMMILTLVESYLVIYAGVLMMGFGGSTWTKDIAIRTLQYTVSVGAKLMVLQLIVGIGEGLIQDMRRSYTAVDHNTIATVLACSIVLLALAKQVPSIVQGLINGMHSNGAGILSTASGVAVGAAAGLAAGVGTGGVIATAGRLAASQTGPSNGGVAGAASRFAAITGRTGANMGMAVASDIGRRLSGQSSGRGMMTWRMAADMAEQRRDLINRPKPPTPPTANGPSIGPTPPGTNTAGNP